jgi:hypothetical protein
MLFYSFAVCQETRRRRKRMWQLAANIKGTLTEAKITLL